MTTSGSGITAGSGDLNAGHTVTLTLNTNEAVDIDTTNGTPTLTLNDGGIATYTGGSGSSALAFSYTVAARRKYARPHGDRHQPQRRHRAGCQRPRRGPDRRRRQSRRHLADRHHGAASRPASTSRRRTASRPRVPPSPFTLDFNEPVAVTGGAPTLTLNDGGSAVYDAAATLALGNADKLVFDHLVSAIDTPER